MKNKQQLKAITKKYLEKKENKQMNTKDVLCELRKVNTKLMQTRAELKKHCWISLKDKFPADETEDLLWCRLNKNNPWIGSFRDFKLLNSSFTHWKHIVVPNEELKNDLV